MSVCVCPRQKEDKRRVAWEVEREEVRGAGKPAQEVVWQAGMCSQGSCQPVTVPGEWEEMSASLALPAAFLLSPACLACLFVMLPENAWNKIYVI